MVQEHDDTDLVAALIHSDAQVSALIYRRHIPMLLRVCNGIVRNRATAEEIAQDTWVAVLKGASQFEGRSSLASWIFAIALNTSRSRAKRDGHSVSSTSSGTTTVLARSLMVTGAGAGFKTFGTALIHNGSSKVGTCSVMSIQPSTPCPKRSGQY